MRTAFEKYHGAGNDFVLVDDRNGGFPADDLGRVRRICHRRFGVGSDGLLLLRHCDRADFEAIFFNPDGSKSLCGNGSRCAVAFAQTLGLAKDEGLFLTTDGIHSYATENEMLSVSMHPVNNWVRRSEGVFMDTGSPHLVCLVPDASLVEVGVRGRELRRHLDYESVGGTNVNFVSSGHSGHAMRTYERGVEAETQSCGTGAVAAALTLALERELESPIDLNAPGGALRVAFRRTASGFEDIRLSGPVKHVFSGTLYVD